MIHRHTDQSMQVHTNTKYWVPILILIQALHVHMHPTCARHCAAQDHLIYCQSRPVPPGPSTAAAGSLLPNQRRICLCRLRPCCRRRIGIYMSKTWICRRKTCSGRSWSRSSKQRITADSECVEIIAIRRPLIGEPTFPRLWTSSPLEREGSCTRKGAVKLCRQNSNFVPVCFSHTIFKS